MRTKRLDFTYKPLADSSYIEIVGSIPNKQIYESATGEYAPDYTLSGSHLALQAHASVYDEDGIITSGDVTSSANLTNIVWTEILTVNNSTTTTVITTSSTDYGFDSSKKGYIEVKRNIPLNGKIVLLFTADFYDMRTAQTLKIRQTMPIELSVSNAAAMLILDKPNSNVWNPFRDPQTQTFTAKVTVGDNDVAASSRTIVWEKQRSNGSWSAIGTETYDDFGYTVSSDGSTYTQNMDYIGEMMNMRVRVTALNGSTISDGQMTEYFSIKRRLPKYDYDYIETPDNVEPDTNYVYPKVLVTDRNGRVDNASSHLKASWYTGAGTASGSPTMELAATGYSPNISTSKINANGMVLGLELTDMGNYKVVKQDDSVVIQDGCVVIGK